MSAHDQWLANYRRYTCEVWCANPLCTLHDDGYEVVYESEYGQGSYTPEDCPLCGGEWLEDKPVLDSPFDPELSEAENRGSL